MIDIIMKTMVIEDIEVTTTLINLLILINLFYNLKHLSWYIYLTPVYTYKI